MTKPIYTITNLILQYIVRYELAIQEILNTKLPEKYYQPLKEKYFAENYHQLGELIGKNIGYNKALQIQRGQELTSEKKDLQIFINIRNTNDFIKSYNKHNALKPSIELASHLNKLAMRGIVEDWDTAKLRGFSEKPNEIYDTWYKERDYYPNTNLEHHFNDIFDWIKDSKDNNHILIKLAVLLYEFIDKAPFLAGNQLTAILMLEIVTKELGYNPENILPIFKSVNMINEDLKAAFRMSKAKRDLTIFIEAFLYSLSLTAIEVSKDFTETFENKVQKRGKMNRELNQRQIKILDFLAINPKATRKDYVKIMDVSFMTAYRDIQELIDKGYVVSKGQGRGTYYVLKGKDEDILLED
jgi:Fic family protein